MTSQLNCDVQLQPWIEDILDGHGLVFRLQEARIAGCCGQASIALEYLYVSCQGQRLGRMLKQ